MMATCESFLPCRTDFWRSTGFAALTTVSGATIVGSGMNSGVGSSVGSEEAVVSSRSATFAPHFVQNWLSSGIQAPQFWQYMIVPNPISANGERHEGRLHRHDDCGPRQRYASRY